MVGLGADNYDKYTVECILIVLVLKVYDQWMDLYTLISSLIVQHVLLRALPPVCMKYTTQGESPVANIAWGGSCILWNME